MRRAPLFALVGTVCLGLALAASPASAQYADDGDLVLIDGGPAQVALVGLMQAWAVPFVGDEALLVNGDPGDRAGFRLRRARLGFKGVAYGLVDFELTVEATPDGVGLVDAWVGYQGLTSLNFVIGARKVPFSRFALVGAGEGALGTRPFAVRAMAPFRQVGLTVEGDIGDGLFRFAAGAYNGFTRRTNFHEGYVEHAALDGNRITNLAYAARVELAPLGPVRRGLADLDHGDLVLGVGGSFYYDDGTTITSLGVGADVLMQVSGLHLAAEFIFDDASPSDSPAQGPTIPADTQRMAVIGELGYVILPRQLGVTARAEWIDDHTELEDNGDQLIVTGGLQYYFRRHHLKAGLEYTHRTELEGLSLANDSLMAYLQFAL